MDKPNLPTPAGINKEDPAPTVENVAGKETVRIPATIIDKQPHMVCHYLVGDVWHSKEFTANKTKYHIGSSSQDSEIGISEPEAERIQVAVQKIGEVWFVMEFARTDLLHINGIPDYQMILERDGYCYLKIGNSKMVLVKGDGQFKIAKGIHGDHKFILQQGENRVAYSSKDPCIIGSDKSADYIINQSMVEDNQDPLVKEPFHAIINSYKNQLFIDSISEKYPVIIKGRAITHATPICAGSQFSIGELEFSIPEAITTPAEGDFMDFSGVAKKTFMLLQILSEDSTTSVINIELPKAGKAVSIGRGNDATYTIPDPRISKEHVQLIIYEKSVLASDMGSTNGTYVNDEKVKKKLMHPSDFLSIGDYAFFLCYADK